MSGGPFGAFRDEDFRWWIQRLVDIGDRDTVHRTLGLRDHEGHNAWFVARTERNELRGYLDDLEAAQALATAAAEDCDPALRAQALGLVCRYALYRATLAELGSRFGPEITARLIEADVWTREQALAWASVSLDAESALETAAAAVRAAGGNERDVLMETVLSTRDRVVTEARTLTLAALAHDAQPHEVAQLLESIASEESEALRIGGFLDLAPVLPPELLGRARAIAAAFDSPESRARALAAVASMLSPPDRDACYEEALTAAAEELGRPTLSGAGSPFLDQLASTLPAHLVERLLSLVEDSEGNARYKVWGAVCRVTAATDPDRAVADAEGLPYWEHDRVLAAAAVAYARAGNDGAALASLREIAQDHERALAVVDLAPVLADPVAPAVVDVLAQLDPFRREEALQAVARATSAPEPALEDFAEGLPRRDERLQAMVAIAPVLSRATLDSLVEELLAPEAPANASSLLVSLAPLLAVEDVRRALDAAVGVASDSGFTALLTRLAEVGSPEEALDAALERPDPSRVLRPRWLAALASRLPSTLLPRTIGALEPNAVAKERVRARSALVTSLQPARVTAVVAEAAALERPADRVRAVAQLVEGAAVAAGPVFARVVRAAVEAAAVDADLEPVVDALAQAVASGEELPTDILASVLAIQPAGRRLQALLHLASGKPEPVARAAADAAIALLFTDLESLEAAARPVRRSGDGDALAKALLDIDHSVRFAIALDAFVRLVDVDLLPHLWRKAAADTDARSRLLAIGAIVERASESLKRRALEAETVRTAEWSTDPDLSLTGVYVMLAAGAPTDEPVVEDVLARAATDPDPLKQLSDLVLVGRLLGRPFPHALPLRVLEAALELDRPEREHTIGLAASLLGSDEVEQACAALAEPAPWPDESRDALIALAQRAVELDDAELAFACLRATPRTFELEPSAVRVVQRMPPTMLRGVVDVVTDDAVTAAALIRAAEVGDMDLALELLEAIPAGTTREEIVVRICSHARRQSFESLLGPARALRVGPRADALAALVEHAPPERRPQLVAEAVRAADGYQSAMEPRRLAVLQSLRADLDQLHPDLLSLLFREAMEAGALRTRSDLLTNVAGLAPSLVAQFGEEAALAIDDGVVAGATPNWP